MEIRTENSRAVRRALETVGRSAKFAARDALNDVANQAQEAVRDSLEDRFTLRRPTFVKRTIYRQRGRDFATGSKLQAAVRVNDRNYAKGSRDFLAKFEQGGTKRARSGRHVAIPQSVKRTGRGGVITRAWRPAALWAKERAGKARVFRMQGRYDPLIVQKVGRGKRPKLRVLYSLVDRVKVPKSLRFRETAARAVRKAWRRAVEQAVEREIREKIRRGKWPA